VKPLSTIAKPHCIKNTSAAPIKNQTPNTLSLTALKIELLINPPIFPNRECSPRGREVYNIPTIKAKGSTPLFRKRTGQIRIKSFVCPVANKII
jgi:hypothetical protein